MADINQTEVASLNFSCADYIKHIQAIADKIYDDLGMGTFYDLPKSVQQELIQDILILCDKAFNAYNEELNKM